MDHAYIEEHQIIDRYLMEKLPPVEAAHFEAHYLHCDQCLAELKLAETFVGDFKRTVAEEADRVTSAGVGLVAWLVRPRRYAALAAVLLAVLCLPVGLRVQHMLVEERGIREDLGQQLKSVYQPQINTVVFPLHRERSGDPSREPSHLLRLGGTPEWIVLSPQLDSSSQEEHSAGQDSSSPVGHVRVSLIDENLETVWQSEDLKPNALSVSIHSSWLSPGKYHLRVISIPSNSQEPVHHQTEQVFRFEVLAGF